MSTCEDGKNKLRRLHRSTEHESIPALPLKNHYVYYANFVASQVRKDIKIIGGILNGGKDMGIRYMQGINKLQLFYLKQKRLRRFNGVLPELQHFVFISEYQHLQSSLNFHIVSTDTAANTNHGSGERSCNRCVNFTNMFLLVHGNHPCIEAAL